MSILLLGYFFTKRFIPSISNPSNFKFPIQQFEMFLFLYWQMIYHQGGLPMQSKLKSHFPMIRDKQELLAEIHGNPNFLSLYNNWEYQRQQEFLDFCTGARGFKLLYDSFSRNKCTIKLYIPNWKHGLLFSVKMTRKRFLYW